MKAIEAWRVEHTTFSAGGRAATALREIVGSLVDELDRLRALLAKAYM
jgi:hypothetical protein